MAKKSKTEDLPKDYLVIVNGKCSEPMTRYEAISFIVRKESAGIHCQLLNATTERTEYRSYHTTPQYVKPVTSEFIQ